jgi:hypothetical protein
MDPRLERLLDLLDSSAGDISGSTVGTSVRLPGNLRDAAVLAAELGLAASTTELTVRGLRDALARISAQRFRPSQVDAVQLADMDIR